MAIQKNSIITKDDIFEYMITKDYDFTDSKSVKGGTLWIVEGSKEGHFWIRNNTDWYKSTEWAVGTTYSIKDRIWVDDSGDIKVFTSMSDSNTGNNPLTESDETNWHEVVNGNVISSFTNVKIDLNIYSSAAFTEYVRVRIWRTTWDVNSDPIDTLIVDETNNFGFNQSYTYDFVPGYYKYRFDVRSYGIFGENTAKISVKRPANDIDQGDKIRVFDSNFKALVSNNPPTEKVTVALAKSGRLTTVDYVGGDYETYVP